MKIGDIVKLVAKPKVDWMQNYQDKTFQVIDFPTENGVEIMMVDTRPKWVWLIGKDNLEITDEGGRPSTTEG